MRNLLTGRLTRTNFLLLNVALAVSSGGMRYLLGPQFGWPDSTGWPPFHPGMPAALLVWEGAALVLWALFAAMRLRDFEVSGRWAWLLPICAVAAGHLGAVGGVLGLALMLAGLPLFFWPPDRGPNRFGPDPRGWDSLEHFERQRRELAGEQLAE